MLSRFLQLVDAAPDAPALIDGATAAVTTRAALLLRARSLAVQWAEAGLTGGDGLAVQLPNSAEFVATFVAALLMKLVVVPVDRDAAEHEVASILGHFGLKGLVYGGGFSVRAVSDRPLVSAHARLVKLTSGSTGKPKGIVTSEANLTADCMNICTSMDIRADDVNLGVIPMSHSYGFSNLVTPLLLQGTAVVVANDYLPQSLIQLANRYSCTVAPLIPMVFDHLAGTPRGDGEFHTVRVFLSAGAPLPAAASRRFRERFGSDIHSFYGCSECGGITYDRRGAAVERGTVGAALHGVTLELNERRLAVRSAAVALGYLHDAQTFEPFTDRAYRTDDLIALTDDGELTITGRSSEQINTAGKKVNPREVEGVILQIDGVRDVRVYGEAAGARGEVVAAAVVASPDVTREQIRAFCRERLALHKVPRIVKLIDALPVDERGKVKRAALAEL